MIVPMKKITLVVLERERTAALEALRKLGVVHVEKRDVATGDIPSLRSLIARIDRACAALADIKVDQKAVVSEPVSHDGALEALARIESAQAELRAALDRKVRVERELERLAPWGDVDPEGFSFLAGKGVFLFPVEMSAREYDSMPDDIRTVIVGRDRKNVRCLVWSGTGQLPAGLPSGVRVLALPETSSAALRAERTDLEALIPAIGDRLAQERRHFASLESLKAKTRGELEFETVKEGMLSVSLGETNLVWLSGFVPLPDEAAVIGAAKKHGWAVLSADPGDDDNVPTKIRNNRFVNLISPLLDFLGTVPGYRELDISLWFLLFFGIFFAMIFGDGGYGAILCAITGYLIVSAKRKGNGVATGLYMILYLGAMTVAWGVVTCTWFGIPTESLPSFLRSIALPAFSNENPAAPTNIKIFCFTLGLIQISLAHVIGMIRNRTSLKLLGELGSLLLAIGMYFVVLNLVVDAERFPLNPVVLAMIGAGFVLNFVFVNYSGKIIDGVLESLKNIITMLLGVVNMFGDIMSYIRLWAVGLAGSAISSTINAMAGPMLGGLIVFAGLVLLLFGHGLNLVMNVLSVIVHGVRLNTLEFSNHLGLTWSGFKYEPFAETAKK